MNHNQLHFYCLVDKRATRSRERLEAFKAEMKRVYPCKFTIELFDGRDVEWTMRNNKYYTKDSFVLEHSKRVKEKHGNEVDAIHFFIDDRNWKQGKVRLRGFKLGRIFDGYYVTATRFRRGYEQTAEHEVLHFVDEYVKNITGVILERIMGVTDFDSDIVHGERYWKRGYYYDEVWSRIGPHISNAVYQRRQKTNQAKINELKLRIKLLMQLLRLLKFDSNSIVEVDIKKHHTTKCYNIPLKAENAVIGHIDLGTEKGTINEILNGSRSASYHWYIPRHAKYVVEFVPKEKSAWHAGALHQPDQGLGKLLGGANEVIESGEPNNYAYGICYEGRNADTKPTQAQIDLAHELMVLKKIDHLPIFEHWRVTSYKPRIVSYFVDGIKELIAKK